MGRSKTPHLLVIRLSAMGDVAMTAHVIESLRQHNPGMKITILTRPFFKPFFRDIKDVGFYAPDFKGRHKGVLGIIRLAKDVRSLGVTHVIDLHNVLRTYILRKLLWFQGGLQFAVIDKGRKEKRALTRKRYKFKVLLKTTVERYRNTFLKAGFNIPELTPRKKTVCALSEEVLSVTYAKKGLWIGVAPFAKHRGKIYPLELMTEVIRMLSARYDKIFIFGGGESEKKYAERVESEFGNVTSVIGKIDLDSELDLISNLDVMISMDSSAMHMSSLYATPVVSVWGATHPYAGFYGFGQDPDNIVQLDMECRPCSIYGNKPCRYGDYRCMHRIPPGIIVEQVDKVISGQGNEDQNVAEPNN